MNGREYASQLETMSGIWYQDLRKKDNAPKALHRWISPNGILKLLEKNISAGNENLQNMPFDLLGDKDGLNLRDYQLKAMQAVESAVISGRQNILLAMATGTGKTRTILGMIYRFLKSGDFAGFYFWSTKIHWTNRRKTFSTMLSSKIWCLLNKFTPSKHWTKKFLKKETRIQVATVQSIVKKFV